MNTLSIQAKMFQMLLLLMGVNLNFATSSFLQGWGQMFRVLLPNSGQEAVFAQAETASAHARSVDNPTPCLGLLFDISIVLWNYRMDLV